MIYISFSHPIIRHFTPYNGRFTRLTVLSNT